MEPETVIPPNSSRRTSAGSECAEAAKLELKNTTDKNAPKKAGDEQQSNSNQEDNDDDDKEGDDDDDDDHEKVIEKSHNERFLKKNAQILSYKVPGVNAYVSFEIKTGKEVLWNDVICESSETKEARLLTQLKKMRRSYHPNTMRILDCWRNENRISFITERPDETYTTLRHWFNISRLSRNAMTSKRLIRQVVSGLKYISDHGLVHGNISTDSILIYGTNVKLGPFALDAFWHSHTVRKTTKKNFYLSSDWSDPTARITSLTDAYAMGILCLEIVMWCPLDYELGEGDVDVPKYVLDKVELFDDPLLRNFIKGCMAGNKHLGINELFDVSAFFEPPSLRHLSAKVLTDSVILHFSSLQPPTNATGASSVTSKQTADINGAYQQLLRHARSSFEVDSVVAEVNLKNGSTRQLLFKDVAQYYISFKFLEDIDHGYYPLIKFDPNGHAIVPSHVRRIIGGDFRKEKEEKDAKEKEKLGQTSTGQSSLQTCSTTDFVATSDQKVRKESKEMASGGSGNASDAGGSTRAAGAAEKVSPPRSGASTASGNSSAVASSAASNVASSRQVTASPARQQPSKLPIIDSSGVRRSASGSGLSAGAAKAAAAEAAKDASVKDSSSTGASASQSTSGGISGASSGAAGAAGPGSSNVAGRNHSGPALGAAKDGKRSSGSRITIASGCPPNCQGVASSTASGGGSGNPGATYGHGVVRRTTGKTTRGAARNASGSTAALLRRRGGSTSPMPQRVRHGVESSGRMSRGGRTYGPRTRRSFAEGTTREHHRRSSQSCTESRSQTQPEKSESTIIDTSTGTTEEPCPRKEQLAGANPLSSDNPEVHSSDEEYEEDYEDYYEDDLEELYEEDEIEYESQFEHRGRREQDPNVLNITDVPPPAEHERGSAYFTDVFFEYLGLGRWLLVVKFHLLRCREDPRGNPYRELMLQLKDNEWHDVDGLLDRLTRAGILMRPEERPILRQYLDAARHNRPLRETYVQNALAGPDPDELYDRLLNVQKEMMNLQKDFAAETEDPANRSEKANSQEPGPPSDPSGQSSRHTEAWSHLRSSQETPASDGINSVTCRAHFMSLREPLKGPRSDASSELALGAKEAPPTSATEGETEAEDEGSGKRTLACSCMPGTHAQNPLEPLNKYCPFCDRCDYLLADGPIYLRSPCYHCRVNSAEKEGLRPDQLYRLHTQNRVPWPLFLQKYFNWPPDDPVTDTMALNECKWRSRVVCVCFHDQDTWPPCVEFPWLYNPPQGSIAYRMQVEQFSPSTHLEPMNLWCRRQSQRTDILKNMSSITSMFRTAEKFPGAVANSRGKRAERDPELLARPPRRARSLTVGSEHSQWSQLFSMSIAMQQPPTSTTATTTEAVKSLTNKDGATMSLTADDYKLEVPPMSMPGSMEPSSHKVAAEKATIGKDASLSVTEASEVDTLSDADLNVPKNNSLVNAEDSDLQHQEEEEVQASEDIQKSTLTRD